MKTCFKCKAAKPATEFYKHAEMGDGYLGKCKECTKMDVRQNRIDRPEHYTNYEKHRAMQPHRVALRERYQQTQEGKESLRKTREKYVRSNPLKRRASLQVNNAVRDGKLAKPSACSECGKGGRIHGHHDDYSEPLVVRWLCPACHVAWHAANGEGANAQGVAA